MIYKYFPNIVSLLKPVTILIICPYSLLNLTVRFSQTNKITQSSSNKLFHAESLLSYCHRGPIAVLF